MCGSNLSASNLVMMRGSRANGNSGRAMWPWDRNMSAQFWSVASFAIVPSIVK